MDNYLGTKLIQAEPMTRQAYNDYRGWALPADENGADEGYLVEYLDGGKPNVPGRAGYVSWSPKEQFDNAYRHTNGLSFGLALEALKKGYKVARAGWNGKGMWLALTPSREVAAEHFWNDHNAHHARTQPDAKATVRPYITMKTVDDEIVPWVASQTDMLADDWLIVY